MEKTRGWRGRRNCEWIEKYCQVPNGAMRGAPVKLSLEEQHIVRTIFDDGQTIPVSGPLAAYLVLLKLCGPEALALRGKELKDLSLAADAWTVWRVAEQRGELHAVLVRTTTGVSCPELGISWAAAA